MNLYSLPPSPFAARMRGAIDAKTLQIEIVAPRATRRTFPACRALNPMVMTALPAGAAA